MKFPINVVVSWYTGQSFCSVDGTLLKQSDLMSIAQYMTNDKTLEDFQLSSVSYECCPSLLKQFPWLGKLEIPDVSQVKSRTAIDMICHAYVVELAMEHGTELDVLPLLPGQHIVFDNVIDAFNYARAIAHERPHEDDDTEHDLN